VVSCSSFVVSCSPSTNDHQLTTNDLYMLRLFVPKRKMIAAKTEFDRIAQRRSANHFDARPVAKPHLQQPTPNLVIPPPRYNAATASDAQFIQSAGLDRTLMVAPSHVTRLCHPYSARSEPMEELPGSTTIYGN